MDAISEEGIDKRVVEHDMNMLTKCLTLDKISTVFDSFRERSSI